MKISILLGGIAAGIGFSFAAQDTVWTAANGNGPKAPAYWYEYKSTGATIDISQADAYKTIKYTVKTSGSSYAGYGFGWKQDENWKDVAISLSSYKGVCLTYKATAPVRLDFKQSTITDDNYYGTQLDSTSEFKKTFVSFADLTQDWKSATTPPAWNAASQLGMQFSYKNTIASTYGASNTFVLSGIILGDECVNYPPELLEPYKSAVEEGTPTVSLNEADTLKLSLGKIFTDPDGDKLTISASILNSDGELSLLGSKKEFSLSDTLKFVPKPNTNGQALVTLTASDGKESVEYKFLVETKDQDNAPTAVNDSYQVNEDETLKVTAVKGILANDSDIDGNDFSIKSNTEPAHGKLTLETSGAFTYVPNADYCGADSWTYTLIDATKLESEAATVKILVSCVNDAPTVSVKDPDVFKNLVYEEDFEGTKVLKISMENLKFTDPDGDKLTYGVLTDGKISATLQTTSDEFWFSFTSVEDANGISTVTVFATDGQDSAKYSFTVSITPVADAPKAHDDSYEAIEDSVLTVAAAKGLLANDVNPDDPTAMLYAYLKTSAAHGKVVLETSGAFTYTPDPDFFGADSFTYYVVNDLSDTSNIAKVRIEVADMNDPPTVAIDTAAYDTLTRDEDFTTAIRYTAAEIKTWFTDPDEDKLYYSVESDDGKLNASISGGIIFIKSVKDSTGDAYVTVTATDSISGSASFKIHVYLTPVNDKPVGSRDTIVELKQSGFEIVLDLDSLFTDPDGDSLTYSLVTANKNFEASIEGSILTIVPADTLEIDPGVYLVRVKAFDPDSASGEAYLYVDIGGTAALPSLKIAEKMNWKQAITQSKGVAKLFDLQGNLLWQGRLPATESDIRNAATRASGKTVLRVNSSRWLLSSESLR